MVLFFPREWEGLHPAFPKEPDAFNTSNPLIFQQKTTFAGVVVGGIWALSRAARRQPPNHALLRAVGAIAIPFSTYSLVQTELLRSDVIEDVRAVLAMDKIAMPRRRLWVRTNVWTADDFATLGGTAATAALLLLRRAPMFPKVGVLSVLGAFTLGHFAATSVWLNNMGAQSPLPMHMYMMELEQGSRIFAQKTGKEPPAWLYPVQATGPESQGMEKKRRNLDMLADAFSSESSSPTAPFPAAEQAADLEELLEAGMTPGLHPHGSVKNSDGTEVFFPQRDYEWNPASKDAGLEALQKHLDVLMKARANRAEEAEYLWNMVACAESRKYPPYGRDQDSRAMRLERKALEFLSSTHCMMWKWTADLDWSIANTKKLILQIQTDGKWMPEGQSVDMPASSHGSQRARDNLLQHLREHLEGLEEKGQMLEAMISGSHAAHALTAPGQQDRVEGEIAEARQELRDNLMVTQQLIDEIERG